MLTINQAAKLLGVSTKTLRRWEKSGKLTSKRSPSGYRLYDPEQLKQLKLVRGFKNELRIEKAGPTLLTSFRHTLEQADQYPQAVKTTWPSLKNIKIVTTGVLVLTLAVVSVFSFKVISSLDQSLNANSQVLGESAARKISGSIDFNLPASFNHPVRFKGSVTASKITAGNLVYSLTSSDGISITDGQDPTIKNTGVLSLQGKTGKLTLTEGADITIDGLKITDKSTLDSVRGRGGCSSCVTDADVVGALTISGGTVNDSAIGATTPSTGAFSTLSASSTLAVTGAATLSSTLSVSGASTLNGNVTLGDASSDTVTFTGRVASSIIPSANGSYDLGSSTYQFGTIYASNMNVSGVNSSGQLISTYVPTSNTVSTGSLYINPTTATSGYTLAGFAVGGTAKLLVTSNGSLISGSDGSADLGSSAVRWNNLFVNTLTASGTNYQGQATFTYTPTSSAIGQGSIWINPTTATSGYPLLSLSVGGAEKARITSDGYLGLGGANDPGTSYLIYAGLPFSVTTSGNVGIGTSNASSSLQINSGQILSPNGTALLPPYSFTNDPDSGLWRIGTNQIALTTGGDAMKGLSINSSGNVGIGTTSPLANLHVVGQCVAGDTLLKRRRRRKNSKGEWEEYFEDVQIKNIKLGDEILTLDENTGRFIVSKVKGLMDMGIQKTYLLITESGKQIRTTGNHPYLVRQASINSTKKALIAESSFSGLCQGWVDNATPSINQNISHQKENVKQEEFGAVDPRGVEPLQATLRESLPYPAGPQNTFVTISQPGKWIKVSELKPGMKIATLDGWETIVAITEYAREQVYDIEVENTHNFVGNDIVAHNTYISGNTGIGALSNNIKLHLTGNGTGTGVQLLTQNSTQTNFGLAVLDNGNVGIGITNATYKLEVSGDTKSNNFYVNGSATYGSTSTDAHLYFGQSARTGGTGGANYYYGSGYYGAAAHEFIGGSATGMVSVVRITSSQTNKPALIVKGKASQSVPLQIWQNSNGLGLAAIDANGNLGIGTTGPQASLGVGGNVGIGSSFAVSAIPTNGLAVEGNVGVGTTSPLANLHVVGQCVAEGTRIRRRRKCKVKSAKGKVGTGPDPDDELETTLEDGTVILTSASNIYTALTADFLSSGEPFQPSLFITTNLDEKSLTSDDILENNSTSILGSFWGNLNQTTAKILSSVKYEKSSSLVTKILDSDLESSAIALSTVPFFTNLKSRPSDLKSWESSILTFSSNRNLWPGVDNGITFLGQGAGILQGGFDMFEVQRRESLKNSFFTFSPGKQFQNLPDHNPGVFEGRLAMTDTGVSHNVFINSHLTHNANYTINTKQVQAKNLKAGDWIKVNGQFAKIAHIRVWIEEEVPVEDIQPDDEVLSLNDKTGEWEWNKVEATLNKGMQTVYRLETQSGKWIETTSEHPYLVKNSHQKTALSDGFIAAVDDKPSNVSPTELPVIYHKTAGLSSIKNASVDRTGFEPAPSVGETGGLPLAYRPKFTEALPLSQIATNWVKISKLKAGQYIATSDGWERIVSITKAGRKQTYDLQIENTHNFVGNDIVAHNTYITGNLGLGVASPASKFHLVGDSTGTGVQLLTQNSAKTNFGLSVLDNGNVGIGTTSPGASLQLNTSASTTNGFTLNANSLSTGTGFYLSSTSTSLSSGYLMYLDWSPGSSTTATGDILGINVGANGIIGNIFNLLNNGSSVFSVSQTQITAAIPTQFTSPGDVSIAYDINMTNPTASYIKSAAPLYIVAGETFGSSDLTLQTYNQGNLILAPSSGNIWADGTNVGIGTTNPDYKLRVQGTGFFSGFVGIGSSLNVTGNVGIGGSITGFGALSGLNVSGHTVLNTLGVTGAAGFSSTGSFGSILSVSDGSSSVPGLNFSSDADSGLYRFAADAIALATGGVNFLSLNPSGNVGVGTTSPLANLHVVGQCVTGDTRLKRRRRRKNSKGEWEEYFEDVMIKDIKEGDEILTLDERSGRLVVSKVKGLMDMGVKDIIKITTVSGKTIKTTAEHPYLTLTDKKQAFAFIDEAGVGKAPDQPIFGVAAFFTTDSLGLNRKLHDIFTGAVSAYNLHQSRFEFKFNAVTKNNLRFFKAIIEALTEDPNWSFAAILTKKGKRWTYWNSYLKILQSLTAKAPFAKLTVVADYLAKPKASNKDFQTITKMDKVASLLQLESQGSLLLQVADILLGALHFEQRQKELGLISGKEAKIKLVRLVKTLLAKKITAIECLHAVTESNISQFLPAVKQEWVKVKDLAEGEVIATVDGWEQIQSIEHLEREQVYDIEVSGTHNFVGNDIVAHNTYITGNTGIGSVSPYAKLHLQGDGVSTGLSFLTTDSAGTQKFAILDNGNVGIGTTGPSSILNIQQNTNGQAKTTFNNPNTGSAASSLFAIGESTNLDLNIIYYNSGYTPDRIFQPNRGLILTDSSVTNGLFFVTGESTAPIGFVTGGFDSSNERMRITSTGNVGIGTISPTGKFIVSGGNVGIGVSSPLTNLAVQGAGVIGWGVTGVAGPSNGLAVSGNVGIGTTSPLANLHVVGQCVTGDTKLRRRKRRKDGTWSDEWEEVEIKDIQEGDEILTLDEATGGFVTSRVNVLMDMGVKDIYELITETGKSIKTTKEHPYLVRGNDLTSGRGLFVEGNIDQKTGNHQQQISNTYFNVEIGKVNHTVLPFLNLYAIDKATIANPTFIVNKKTLVGSDTWRVNGIAMAAANQPEPRLTKLSDNIIKNAGSGFITNTLTNNHLPVNKSEEWIKVSQIRPGMEVATIGGWEKIVSIRRVGREQVFDIEVENTHNFVGNGIVAHNTYISGNLGIGNSAPSYPIQVGTDGTNGNGAYLSLGGIWTDGSSAVFKENFTKLSSQEILGRINELSITQWNYINEGEGIKHIGPISEQFYSIFGLGNDNKHIAALDTAGVALLGIQGLSQEIADLRFKMYESTASAKEATKSSELSLEDKIASLSAEINDLRLMINDLQKESTPSVIPAEAGIHIASSSAYESSPSASDNFELLTLNSQLDLTPPDILISTQSAVLTNLSVKSEATISGMLKSYQAEIQDHFKVFGNTSLGNTTIAGDLTVDGTMNISGNSLSILGTLYLQNGPLAQDIDLFAGKVKIDNQGNIVTQGDINVAGITITNTDSQKPTIGSGKILAGQTEVIIPTKSVTQNSKIFVTSGEPVAMGVSKNPAANSFTVKIEKSREEDLNFDWWVIGTEPSRSIVEESIKYKESSKEASPSSSLNTNYLLPNTYNVPSWQDSGSGIAAITDPDIEFINVRKEPDSSSEIITQIYPGTVFNILQEENNWIKIEYQPDVYGWVLGSLVSRK